MSKVGKPQKTRKSRLINQLFRDILFISAIYIEEQIDLSSNTVINIIGCEPGLKERYLHWVPKKVIDLQIAERVQEVLKVS